jgi:hypothetical protein
VLNKADLADPSETEVNQAQPCAAHCGKFWRSIINSVLVVVQRWIAHMKKQRMCQSIAVNSHNKEGIKEVGSVTSRL